MLVPSIDPSSESVWWSTVCCKIVCGEVGQKKQFQRFKDQNSFFLDKINIDKVLKF